MRASLLVYLNFNGRAEGFRKRRKPTDSGAPVSGAEGYVSFLERARENARSVKTQKRKKAKHTREKEKVSQAQRKHEGGGFNPFSLWGLLPVGSAGGAEKR